MVAPFIKRRYQRLREVVAEVVEAPVVAEVVEAPAEVEEPAVKKAPAPKKRVLKKAPKKAFRKE
mgnify:CR=1 FL=1